LGLRQGEIARQSDDEAQLRIEPLQAVEIQKGEALGGDLAGFDPAGKL
jgi:hypothetical protein